MLVFKNQLVLSKIKVFFNENVNFLHFFIEKFGSLFFFCVFCTGFVFRHNLTSLYGFELPNFAHPYI